MITWNDLDHFALQLSKGSFLYRFRIAGRCSIGWCCARHLNDRRHRCRWRSFIDQQIIISHCSTVVRATSHCRTVGQFWNENQNEEKKLICWLRFNLNLWLCDDYLALSNSLSSRMWAMTNRLNWQLHNESPFDTRQAATFNGIVSTISNNNSQLLNWIYNFLFSQPNGNWSCVGCRVVHLRCESWHRIQRM